MQSNNNVAAIASRFIRDFFPFCFAPVGEGLRLDQVHGSVLRLLPHEALCVRPVKAFVAFPRQLGGICDAAFLGEEQEDLLATDDASDSPAIAVSGDVSAALGLKQDDRAPILFMPVAVDIDCGRLAMDIEPRFALGVEILRAKANAKNKDHSDRPEQRYMLFHLQLLDRSGIEEGCIDRCSVGCGTIFENLRHARLTLSLEQSSALLQ